MVTCTTCGRLNPETARFCSACGAELVAVAAREVRKTVTAVFADVTGSTALGEQLDPESQRHVMASYFDLARECLERHGGSVEKFIGDAVMAVFGVPTAHEDDALRALRAASDLRDSLVSLNDELDRDYGVTLQLRTGVNTGEVVTGTVERLATGDAVNVAARLEQAAQPGEILIGEQTRRLARGAIETERVEPLTLKGKTDPVLAYRLLQVIEGAPAFERRLDVRLVGRREELMRMRAAFDSAVSARCCCLVTVLGPPGIGKSRLGRELGSTLADEADVLHGRCLPYGEGITYWPLAEIFREAGAEAELEAALAAGASEEIFWSVRKALERLARARPVALVLEDVHWAEPTLLDLVEHLVDWTRDAPILVLCLARPELIDDRPAWGGLPNSDTFMLEPLSEIESSELIDELFEGPSLDPGTRERVGEVAAGNPLFVEQLLAMLAEGGRPEDVPPTIQALLAARLDSLPEEERDVLERASVVGLEFEWDALRELAADRERPAGALLAALVRKELVGAHAVIEDSFSFRHMLIRDAAYERIPKERRSELHERFAGWVEGRGEEFDEVIGYHLEQAHLSLAGLGRPGERARALADGAAEHLARAGRRAYARSDTRASVNLLARAAALLPSDDVRRLRLLPSLARAEREAGDLDRAESVLAEAIDRARDRGERAIGADAAVALADLRLHRRPDAVSVENVWREIDAAIAVFDDVGDQGGLARALVLAGKMRFWSGEAASALEDLERAARNARDAGDRAEEAESLLYVLSAMRFGPMPVDQALGRAGELGARAGLNRRLEVGMLQVRASLEAMQGCFDAARDSVAQARAAAEEYGLHVMLDTHIRPAAGNVELLAGDPAAAEAFLRPACESAESMGELGFLSSITPYLVDSLFLQGRDEEALGLSDRWRPERITVPDDIDAQAGWRRVRAKVLARLGGLGEAERLAREAVAIVSETDYLDARAQSLADLGVVLRFAGRAQESAAALEEAIALHEEKGNVAAARRARDLLARAGDASLRP